MPETVSAIIVLLAFVTPGFIATRVLELAFPRTEPQQGRIVLEGLALSCLNYGTFSWLFVIAWKERWHETLLGLTLLTFFALFLAPVLLALSLIRISDTRSLRRLRSHFHLIHPVPKAWDYFFRQARPCWIVATLKDGHVVAGLYGNNSFTSSFPADEDIYVERLCTLSAEGKITGLAKYSRGAIIRMENVVLLEFYDLK